MPVCDFLIQSLVTLDDTLDGEMVDGALAGSRAQGRALVGPGGQKLCPGLGQGHGLGRRHESAGSAHDRPRIADVRNNARNPARHGLDDHVAERLAVRRRRGGHIERRRQPGHVLAHTEEVDPIAETVLDDPLSEPRVVRRDVFTA